MSEIIVQKVGDTIYKITKEIQSLLIKDNICCKIIEDDINPVINSLKEHYKLIEKRFSKDLVKQLQKRKIKISFEVYETKSYSCFSHFLGEINISHDSDISDEDIKNFAKKAKKIVKTFYTKHSSKLDLSVFYIGFYIYISEIFNFCGDVIEVYGDEFFL